MSHITSYGGPQGLPFYQSLLHDLTATRRRQNGHIVDDHAHHDGQIEPVLFSKWSRRDRLKVGDFLGALLALHTNLDTDLNNNGRKTSYTL